MIISTCYCFQKFKETINPYMLYSSQSNNSAAFANSFICGRYKADNNKLAAFSPIATRLQKPRIHIILLETQSIAFYLLSNVKLTKRFNFSTIEIYTDYTIRTQTCLTQ
jgi:hypothetical protein